MSQADGSESLDTSSGSRKKRSSQSSDDVIPNVTPEQLQANLASLFGDKKRLVETFSAEPPEDYPRFRASDNPATEAIARTLETGEEPENVSLVSAVPAFDSESYWDDPTEYLSKSQPGRVFQTAKPTEDTIRIRAAGPRFLQLKQGEAATLSVRAPYKVPVSFTIFDGGIFDNGLTAITVAADANGKAEVRFTASANTINETAVLAASPILTGRVRFTLNVLEAGSL
ncbi:MAG: hypothetical protein AAF664_26170 [Planctomycetota bacterium]